MSMNTQKAILITKDRIETIKTLIDSKKYTYEQNTNLKLIFEKLKN